MSEEQTKEALSRLSMALEKAEYETLKGKAMKNEIIVQSDGKGGCRKVPARDVFTTLYKEPVPEFEPCI